MAHNEQVGRINQSLEAMLKTGLFLHRSDDSDEVEEEQSDERGHQEGVDDEPGHQPGPRLLPDCYQEDELCAEEDRDEEEEDEIIQTVSL